MNLSVSHRRLLGTGVLRSLLARKALAHNEGKQQQR